MNHRLKDKAATLSATSLWGDRVLQPPTSIPKHVAPTHVRAETGAGGRAHAELHICEQSRLLCIGKRLSGAGLQLTPQHRAARLKAKAARPPAPWDGAADCVGSEEASRGCRCVLEARSFEA